MISIGSTVQVLIFIHSLIGVCCGAEEPAPSSWDYLIFTQEWPQSACIAYKGDNSQRACEIFSNVTAWTVHGVWPTKAGTRGPHNCQKLPFDLEKLRQIEPNLLQSWPNIFAGKSVYSLWKHEWLKHGTCAAELPAIGDEQDYFSLGLQWSAHYQALPVLAAGSVLPGPAAYSWAQIRDALATKFNTRMIVDCELDRETKSWYLSQIKLCLDKSFSLTDCHNKSEPISTGCPADGILYPPIIPTPVPVNQDTMSEAGRETAPGAVPVKNELLEEIVQIELLKDDVEPPAYHRHWYWYRLIGRYQAH